MLHRRTRLVTALVFLSFTGIAIGQDIEPRRWTPLPVGMNVLGAGFVHTDGDIAFDPVLEIDDATVEIDTAIVSYLHAFELLGKSARFDIRSGEEASGKVVFGVSTTNFQTSCTIRAFSMVRLSII